MSRWPLLLLLLLCACATPSPPTGGPEDRKPPRLVRSDPANGATKVLRPEIRLWFDEWIDPASLERALELTPYPAAPPRVAISGRSVRIRLPRLEAERTYVLILTTELRDLRGNRLERPIELAFSTGARLDTLGLSGLVLLASTGQAPSSPWTVGLYRIESDQREPARADYITQTGPDGRFRFRSLSPGSYWVLAYADYNGNRRPDGQEPRALADQGPIRLPADTLRRPLLGHPPDPGPLRLAEVRVLGTHLLEARFSGPWRGNCPEWTLLDSAEARWSIAGWYRAGPRSARLLLAEPLRPGAYRLIAEGMRDSLERQTGSLSVRFRVLRTPNLRSPPPPREDRARLAPPDTLALLPSDSLRLELSLPLEAEALRRALRLYAEAEAIPYMLSSAEAVTCGQPALIWWVRPQAGWPAGALLRVRFEDTLQAPERAYRVLRSDDEAVLSGTVLAAPEQPVELWLFAAGIPEPVRRIRLVGSAVFHFAGLRPDRYRIFAFADRNGNGRWDGGQPWDNLPEPAWWSEPIRLRPRWEVAGIRVELR